MLYWNTIYVERIGLRETENKQLKTGMSNSLGGKEGKFTISLGGGGS